MGDGMQSLDRDKEEIDRVAGLLINAWTVAEGSVPNVSYIATFADMARAVVADRKENERWRDRFNAAVEDAQNQRDALFTVRKAWLDSGPEPAYHRMHQDNLRRKWPVLYDAIRKAVYYDGKAI